MDILNTGFDSYSDAALVAKAELIIESVSTPPGSDYYDLPGTELADVITATTAFSNDIAKGNAPGAAEARVVTRAALISALKLLAAKLEATTPGERAKLATSGFDLRKIPVHNADPTGIPQNVKAKTTGNPGEAKLSCDSVPHAATYECRAGLHPEGPVWVTGPCATKIRELVFTGLERGKDWFFQIRAIGPNGTGPWSDVAMMMVV